MTTDRTERNVSGYENEPERFPTTSSHHYQAIPSSQTLEDYILLIRTKRGKTKVLLAGDYELAFLLLESGMRTKGWQNTFRAASILGEAGSLLDREDGVVDTGSERPAAGSSLSGRKLSRRMEGATGLAFSLFTDDTCLASWKG